MQSLAVPLKMNAEELVAGAQEKINHGAATQYEAKISQALRLKGIALKISALSDAAVVFKGLSSEPAMKLVHPAILGAALAVTRAPTGQAAEPKAASKASASK